MKLPSRNVLLFNGAAAIAFAASMGFALQSALFGEEAEPCTTRYAQGMRISLERNGAPLAGADLQSRFNGTDWGVLDHSRVVKLKSGPAPLALEFDLNGTKPDDRDPGNGREGIGFLWTPSQLKAPKAACLAYSVFLPEGFDFGSGGRLPGLMGERIAGDGSSEQGAPPASQNGSSQSEQQVADPLEGTSIAFSTRYAWRDGGTGDIFGHIPSMPEGRSLGNDRSGFKFERGSWVELEQEVVLNDPGKPNGLMRVWVNGRLRIEKTNVAFQATEPAQITGVFTDVVMMGREVPAGGKAQKIWVTPYELRWN